jgi:hypothetical protein
MGRSWLAVGQVAVQVLVEVPLEQLLLVLQPLYQQQVLQVLQQ